MIKWLHCLKYDDYIDDYIYGICDNYSILFNEFETNIKNNIKNNQNKEKKRIFLIFLILFIIIIFIEFYINSKLNFYIFLDILKWTFIYWLIYPWFLILNKINKWFEWWWLEYWLKDNEKKLYIGEKLIIQWKFEEALDIFNFIITKDNNNPLYLLNRAYIYNEVDKIQEWLLDCEKAYDLRLKLSNSELSVLYTTYISLLLANKNLVKADILIIELISELWYDWGLLYYNFQYFYLNNNASSIIPYWLKQYNLLVKTNLDKRKLLWFSDGILGWRDLYPAAEYIYNNDLYNALDYLDVWLENGYNNKPYLLQYYWYYYTLKWDYDTALNYLIKAYENNNYKWYMPLDIRYIYVIKWDTENAKIYLNEALRLKHNKWAFLLKWIIEILEDWSDININNVILSLKWIYWDDLKIEDILIILIYFKTLYSIWDRTKKMIWNSVDVLFNSMEISITDTMLTDTYYKRIRLFISHIRSRYNKQNYWINPFSSYDIDVNEECNKLDMGSDYNYEEDMEFLWKRWDKAFSLITEL